MKYYTPELWSKVGSPDKEEREAAHAEWDKNVKEYSLIFDKLKSRLPKKVLKSYYDNKGFHDFDLINISIEQSSSNRKLRNPVSINMDIISPDIDATFRITYYYPELFEIHYKNLIIILVLTITDMTNFFP